MSVLLITDPLPAAPFAAALQAAAPDMELLSWHPDLDAAAMQGVDAVLAWRFPRGVVERLPRLRWVCAIAAGVEKLLVPELPAAVAVSRIVDAEQGRCVAHYVAAMALRHARRCRCTRHSSAGTTGRAIRSPAASTARSACSAAARWGARWRDCSRASTSACAASAAAPAPSRTSCPAATSSSARCR